MLQCFYIVYLCGLFVCVGTSSKSIVRKAHSIHRVDHPKWFCSANATPVRPVATQTTIRLVANVVWSTEGMESKVLLLEDVLLLLSFVVLGDFCCATEARYIIVGNTEETAVEMVPPPTERRRERS